MSILPSESTSAIDQIWANTAGGRPEASIRFLACSPVMKSEREGQIRTNCDSYLAFWSGVITNRSDGGGDDTDIGEELFDVSLLKGYRIE